MPETTAKDRDAERPRVSVAPQIIHEPRPLEFLARAFVLTSLPHGKPKGLEWTRYNRRANTTLALVAPSRVGLPYGKAPRLLLAWLTTQALREKKRILEAPGSYQDFLNNLGVPGGTMRRAYRQQLQSLFATSFYLFDGKPPEMIDNALNALQSPMEPTRGMGFVVADSFQFWWSRGTPDEEPRFEVQLSERFFELITAKSVPLDARVLRRLDSSLAIDIYTWLTHSSMASLRRREPLVFAWEDLEEQFGGSYRNPYEFRRNFRAQLKSVLEQYDSPRPQIGRKGITLPPFQPHVPPREVQLFLPSIQDRPEK